MSKMKKKNQGVLNKNFPSNIIFQFCEHAQWEFVKEISAVDIQKALQINWKYARYH